MSDLVFFWNFLEQQIPTFIKIFDVCSDHDNTFMFKDIKFILTFGSREL